MASREAHGAYAHAPPHVHRSATMGHPYPLGAAQLCPLRWIFGQLTLDCDGFEKCDTGFTSAPMEFAIVLAFDTGPVIAHCLYVTTAVVGRDGLH